jgi:hypothetical protein
MAVAREVSRVKCVVQERWSRVVSRDTYIVLYLQPGGRAGSKRIFLPGGDGERPLC